MCLILQVAPDYLKGLLNVVPQGKASEQQFQQVAKLAALQHRAKDSAYLPSLLEVQECIPVQLCVLQRPQQWLNMVTQHMQQIQALSPHQARAQFLGKELRCSKHNQYCKCLWCILYL
uniref:FERM central domain-containing protein n=1 Tax=Astyanax mexicanus TaxID=7994 RepID=A0A3B1K1Z0_ASTMX